MNRLSLLAIAAVAVFSLGISAVTSAQEATPSPSPTTPATPNICVGDAQRGGKTITVLGRTEIGLPGGANFVIGTNPRGASSSGTAFTVCYVEGNARVTISTSDCDETGRDNPTDNKIADLVLDGIVDSCEVIAQTPTPTPAANEDATPTATATGGGTTITPPDTGDAGLK